MTSAAGPTLVLVHRLGRRCRPVGLLLSELSATHRVIALELLGVGRSDKPNIIYRIDGFDEVLARLSAGAW